jgi:hypothetical protein
VLNRKIRTSDADRAEVTLQACGKDTKYHERGFLWFSQLLHAIVDIADCHKKEKVAPFPILTNPATKCYLGRRTGRAINHKQYYKWNRMSEHAARLQELFGATCKVKGENKRKFIFYPSVPGNITDWTVAKKSKLSPKRQVTDKYVNDKKKYTKPLSCCRRFRIFCLRNCYLKP